MRMRVSLALIALFLVAGPAVSDAQDLRQLFRNVSPSVAVIRAKGQDVTAAGRVTSARPARACSSRPTARS